MPAMPSELQPTRITLIAAVGRNRAIGRGNALPWRLPEDLAHFKKLTHGHPIIMGRRTWQSIGRALPGRRNLVLSGDAAFAAAGAEVFAGLPQALQACVEAPEVFIIGGAAVYAQALPLARRLWLTEVDDAPQADTFFPAWPRQDFEEVERTRRPAGDGRPAFDFVLYERRRPAPA